MIASSHIVSCNFSLLPLKFRSSPPFSSLSPSNSPPAGPNHRPRFSKIPPFFIKQRPGHIQTRWSSLNTQSPQDPRLTSSSSEAKQLLVDGRSGGGGGGGGGGEERDWTTSFLLFGLWAGLMYYVFFIAPNQTPATDSYFVQKLLNLKGDDGFEMNKVVVAEWYIMALWPWLYTMLLLPTARSSKSQIPVWPFVSLSFIAGSYALIPYFILWRPPAPPVKESELRRWPLNFLESKLTAGFILAAGLATIVYALSSGGDAWKEFYQYFNGSKFIHVTSVDLVLLSSFAPFWVYNDMTARKWCDKGSWLIPLSLIPFLGPALYLVLRPSLWSVPEALAPTSDET